jgi:para-nitrobenzyl esterase
LPLPERLHPREARQPPAAGHWILGGGFSSGSGDIYDGSRIAKADNVNYRLGGFGFLDLPGLSSQGSGDYGLLDQEAALRWTHRDIGAFGGDLVPAPPSGPAGTRTSPC